MRGFGECLPFPEKYNTSKLLGFGVKYRSSIEVIASILEAGLGIGAAQRIILTHSGITHLQFKKYLANLTERGFMEMGFHRGHAVYRTSRKGHHFLNQYHLLLEMLMNTSEYSSIGTIGTDGSEKPVLGTGSVPKWMR